MPLTRKEMLQAFLAGAQGSNPYAEGGEARKTAQTQSQLGVEAEKQKAQNDIDQALGLQDQMARRAPGHKYNIHVGNTTLSEADQMPNLSAQLGMERLRQNKEEALSKRYENLSDFSSNIHDIDKLSNADGSGGFLSNPNAKLPGTGKFLSTVPAGLLGLGESLGAPGVDKGSAEMRKALDRIQLTYAKALGGARGVNPAMISKEKEAMGYIASGDPDLVKKGILSLVQNVKDHYKTIQSGYSPDVIAAVHQRLGGNPLDAYGSMVETGPAGAPVHGGAPQPKAAAPAQPPAGPSNDDLEKQKFVQMFLQQKQAMKQQPKPPQGQ